MVSKLMTGAARLGLLACLLAGPAWGFSDATLRDSFDRADGALGANWTDSIISTDTSTLVVVSNGVSKSGTAGSGSAWWHGETFGPDVKVSLTTPDATTTGNTFSIYLRLTSPGVASSTDAYACRFTPSTSTLDLLRIDNSSTGTVLATTASAPLVDGGKIGCEVIGTVLTAYVDTGSGYVAVATATDSTYTAAGHVGLRTNTTTMRSEISSYKWTVWGGGFVNPRRKILS